MGRKLNRPDIGQGINANPARTVGARHRRILGKDASAQVNTGQSFSQPGNLKPLPVNKRAAEEQFQRQSK